MPQDGLRSAIYRSFVTCNDPKGVVTCRTFRRYKANCPHKMEGKREIINPRKMKSSVNGPEEIIVAPREELHTPASFQLMEVSRGAQKLDKMIERWSGGQSKGIAKDFLKGAMDLQDSLVMLGKLQEASRYMARLKREVGAMEGSGRGRDCRDESEAWGGVGRARSDDQKARVSFDGSSTEELKKVVRESLVKQSLVLPKKKAGREVESAPASESPLTTASSGQSSSSARQGPNLIAKLMGLEEIPSKNFVGQNAREQPKRPVSDIDSSRVGGSRYANPERRSLREILESMRFEGPNCHVAAPDSEKKLIDDGQPIVLIKPLRAPCSEPKEMCRSAALEEEDTLCRRTMLRKLRESGELQQKKVVEYSKGDSKPDRRLGKKAAEATRSKGTREQRATVEVSEDKRAVIKENSSVKSRSSSSTNHRQQRNTGAEKRGDKVQNTTNVNRNSLEKKTRSVVTSEDQAIRTSIKERKTGSEANTLKNQNPRRSSLSPPKPSPTKRADQTASSYQKKSYTKKEKPAKKPAVAKAVETSGIEEGEKRTGLCSGINTDPETQVTILPNRLPKKENADNSESKIEDVTGRQSSLCVATPSTPCCNHENHSHPAEEEAPIDINVCEPEDNLKALLLSSVSFQNRAEELFDLNMNSSGASRASRVEDFGGASSAKLLLDCANELIERRSFQEAKTAKLRRGGVSIETLAEEICRGIETLRSYAELSGERLIVDCLYAMLERDMMCRGAANGIWDCGWRSGFSLDDAERVVSDLEKLVLSGLIEEVFL